MGQKENNDNKWSQNRLKGVNGIVGPLFQRIDERIAVNHEHELE